MWQRNKYDEGDSCDSSSRSSSESEGELSPERFQDVDIDVSIDRRVRFDDSATSGGSEGADNAPEGLSGPASRTRGRQRESQPVGRRTRSKGKETRTASIPTYNMD